jgi:hypothetical protein
MLLLLGEALQCAKDTMDYGFVYSFFEGIRGGGFLRDTWEV